MKILELIFLITGSRINKPVSNLPMALILLNQATKFHLQSSSVIWINPNFLVSNFGPCHCWIEWWYSHGNYAPILCQVSLLAGRHINIPARCSMCLQDDEIVDHLFLTCLFAKGLRFGSYQCLRTELIQPSNVIRWLRLYLQAGIQQPQVHKELIFPVAVIQYTTWYTRNRAIFQGATPDAASTLILINEWMMEYIDCRGCCKNQSNASQSIAHIWQKPQPIIHQAAKIYIQPSKTRFRSRVSVQSQGLFMVNGIYNMAGIFRFVVKSDGSICLSLGWRPCSCLPR